MNELPLELENLILKYVRYVPLNKIEMKERLTDEYINLWDVMSITDMSSIFQDAENFNGDLSKWDTSSVTNMRAMFYYATEFNGDLSNWDTSNVETGLEHGK